MKQEVQDFIEKAKNLKKEHDADERAQVLISAGLYEEQRVYSKVFDQEHPNWDTEKLLHYGCKRAPIDVTDEEYAEILKYSELVKGLDESKNSDSPMDNIGAENTLISTATVELVCGIILFVILLFAGLIVEGFGLYGVCIGGAVLIMSIVNWAIMKVLANISMSLKEINRKVK